MTDTSSSVATVNNILLSQTEPSEPFLHLIKSLVATHTMSKLWKGIAGMPAANASWAPLFSRKMKDVLDFLDDFEQQAELCGLTDAAKCSMVICYLDNKMQMLWKNAIVLHSWIWNKLLLNRGRKILIPSPSFLSITANSVVLLSPYSPIKHSRVWIEISTFEIFTLPHTFQSSSIGLDRTWLDSDLARTPAIFQIWVWSSPS